MIHKAGTKFVAELPDDTHICTVNGHLALAKDDRPPVVVRSEADVLRFVAGGRHD